MEVDHVVQGADTEPAATRTVVHKANGAKKGGPSHGTPMRRQLRYWQPFNDWCARAAGQIGWLS